MKIAGNIVNFMCRIYRMKLTTATGGNISIKDSEGNIWITPASLDKSNLSPEDIVCIKKDGTVVGKHKPSSELMFHQSIYYSRPDISTILHAHPDPLVTFSAIERMPDISLYYGLEEYLDSVGHVEYALTGSTLLATKMAHKFSEGHSIVLLENHGVVSVGKDLPDAYARFDALIHLARIEINSATLGKLHSPTRQLQPYRAIPRQESGSSFVNDKLDYVEQRKAICDFNE